MTGACKFCGQLISAQPVGAAKAPDVETRKAWELLALGEEAHRHLMRRHPDALRAARGVVVSLVRYFSLLCLVLQDRDAEPVAAVRDEICQVVRGAEVIWARREPPGVRESTGPH